MKKGSSNMARKPTQSIGIQEIHITAIHIWEYGGEHASCCSASGSPTMRRWGPRTGRHSQKGSSWNGRAPPASVPCEREVSLRWAGQRMIGCVCAFGGKAVWDERHGEAWVGWARWVTIQIGQGDTATKTAVCLKQK